MNRAVLVDGTNIDGFLSKYNVITCKLRNSRIKSKQLGIMEMLLSNYDLDIIFIKNGPLSDVKGIVSFFVKKENWDEVQNRLKNIGYFNNNSTDDNSYRLFWDSQNGLGEGDFKE